MSAPAARELTVALEGRALSGEAQGEGPAVILLHGLTATRRYVLHGSKALPRQGYETFAYDARGHGESDPAPAGEGYAYPELAADLGAVIEQLAPERRCLLAGHSMGAHTLTAYALSQPDRVAGLVIIGPATLGEELDQRSLAYWDALAEGLERDGVEGFMRAYDRDLDPEWRDVMLRITRERLGRHRHPQAVAQALREVSRSSPFGEPSELAGLELPALVVASHDEADPGHPYDVAAAWAEQLPRATLISEEPGASPLAWQGGKLSREIAAFCERPEVTTRLAD